MGDLDSVARRFGGVEVSVALPTVHMCRTRHLLHQAHVKHHTWSDNERTGRGFANATRDNQPVTECVHHTKLRSQEDVLEDLPSSF